MIHATPRQRGTREFRHVFIKELRDVVRDRRAAFFTFVFPLLLYPVLFFISRKVDELEPGTGGGESVRVGLSGDYGAFHRLGEDDEALHVVRDVPLRESLLEDGEFDVLLSFAEEGDGTVSVRVLHDGALPMSRAALRSVKEVLERYRSSLVVARLEGEGVEVPAAGVIRADSADLAAGGERASALVARFLPSILILLFFTGGAFAALDLVAGEKERGTLETLLVQPVSARTVAAAKFLVVVVCSFASAAINVAAILMARGLQAGEGALAELSLPPAPTLAVVALILLLLAVITSAALLAVSTAARTFREAQTYLVPLMLLAVLPSLLAAMPNVRLDLLTVWIPIGNVSLAVRDAFAGEIAWTSLALVFLSTALYAIATVRWAAGLLTGEDVIVGTLDGRTGSDALERPRVRRAVFFGAAMLLLVYYAGTLLQSPDGVLGPRLGLAVTLWVVVLLPAALWPRVHGVPLRRAWALERPRAGDLLAAVLAAPAVAILVSWYMALQEQVLPVPRGIQESLRELFQADALHPAATFLLFAFSPAICEELLWRGTFQGEVSRGERPARTIVIVGIFFGLFHLSVHRFVPTALLGCALAFLRLRTGSIFPSMALHCAYNALVLFVVAPLHEGGDAVLDALFHPLGLAAAAGVVFLAARWVGRSG